MDGIGKLQLLMQTQKVLMQQVTELLMKQFMNNFMEQYATTADAWNIFDTNWDTNNGEDVLTTIYRRDKSSLDMFDFKISK